MAEINETPQSGEIPDTNKQAGPNADTKPSGNVQQDEISKEISKDARMWAMFCHLAGLAGYLFPVVGNIVAPLIIWQIKKDDFSFVDQHGKEAVNFQISMSLYALISLPLIPICVGAFLLAAVVIVDLVFLLIAAVKANDGKSYRYPLTIRFIK